MRKTVLVAVVSAVIGALVATPLAVYASHSFTDVPDSNTFHTDIEWLANAGVTKGCNPPDNTRFCPDDNVTREAMAAFMHRLAQFLDAEDGTPGQADHAISADNAISAEDADTVDGKHAAAFLAKTEKASDSEKLDGQDSTSFLSGLSAGVGLAGGGSGGDIAIALEPGYRLPQSCAEGEVAKLASGAWACGTDLQGGAASSWLLGGNSGTTAGTDFLGTTDDEAMEIHVNGARGLRLEPAPSVSSDVRPNVVAGSDLNQTSEGVFGATIAGGGGEAGDFGGTSSGTRPNIVTDSFGAVGGGWNNTAGDGDPNSIEGRWSVVGGGSSNTAAGFQAVVSGGNSNTADGLRSSVGGGFTNIASGSESTIGGGNSNVAGGDQATVAGGDTNDASGLEASVGGGWSNTASGLQSTIAGGSDNTASGQRATVPGGLLNSAAGDQSFAGGTRSKVDALHPGAFLWADSTSADFNSAAADEFSVRASGGYRFFTDSGLTTGAVLAASSGSWSSVSDRSVKADFRAIDPQIILDAVGSLPLSTWRYQGQDASIRHIGPTAQDFFAAFSVGEDPRFISSVDADGVALAAIQGLYEVIQDKEAQIAALAERVDAVESASPGGRGAFGDVAVAGVVALAAWILGRRHGPKEVQ